MGTSQSNLTKESTSYFVINDKNMYYLEKKLMGFSGLKSKNMEFLNIKVGTLGD